MIKGSVSKDSGHIISPNAKILSIVTTNGTTYVNLSIEFKEELESGRSNEILAIYSIVNSLTELRTVKNVKILIEGKEVSYLQEYMPLNNVYKRNLEIVNNAIKTPIETLKNYYRLNENGDYRQAFDVLYSPASFNIDYSMYYHYQKEKDVEKYNIQTYSIVESDEMVKIKINYKETKWSGEEVFYTNKEIIFKDVLGEWKIVVDNLSVFLDSNQIK